MIKLINKMLLLLVIPGIVFSKTLSISSMYKLSPDLQALVAEKNPETAYLTDNRFSKTHTVTGVQQEVLYPVTIRSTDIELVKAAGIKTNSDHTNWSTARVTYDQLIQLTEIRAVTDIFQGDMFYPLNDLAVGESGADLVHDAYLNNVAYDGTDVIVLIIDTGIDWSHLDFRDPADDTKSRILYIWDQTLTKTGAEGTPQDRDGTNFSGLNYGVEYTQTHIEDEIDGSAANFVREDDTNGHGTAVASGAVSNGASLSNTKYKGMAPDADIVIVKAGVSSFSDNNVKDALTYAEKISATESKPVVVNLSLGNHSNAHDGTSTMEVAVDDFVGSANGRVAVVAAGNEGNDPIHVTGDVSASSTESITITVPSFSPISGSVNDYFAFELWWNNNDDVTAEVESPSNIYSYTRTAGQTGTSSTNHGTIKILNATDSDHTNGDRRNYIEVYDGTEDVGPEVGDWTVKVTNNSGSTMTYHAWLFGSSMGATVTGGDSSYTISSPGTASSAITVGAYTARWRWYAADGNGYGFSGTDLSDDIAYFASYGPTRGGVQKPDICTAGRGLISATSTDYTPSTKKRIVTNKYHLTEGTSGAAGIASGAVALILDYDGTLSAAIIKSKLTANADTDTYTGSVPNYEWGYGKLNIFESLAKTITSSATVDHDIYSYEAWGSTAAVNIGSSVKEAVKFTPSTAGDVTGVFFHTYTSVPTSGSLSFEVWSDNSGLPNSKLGSTVTMSTSNIGKYTWNYLALKATGVSVSASTDYHLVIDNTTDSTYSLLAETGAVDNRSSRDLGGGWGAYGDRDWRIRPVVSTDESTLDSSLPVELAFFNAASEKGHIILKWATESETENLGFKLDRRTASSDWQLLADHTTDPELQGQGSTTSRTDYAFADYSVKPGVRYDYRLSDISYSAVSKANSVILEGVQLLIEEFELFSNYPNPFNPSTRIAYQIGHASDVKIRITDIQGREIRSWQHQSQDPGYYETRWDGLNELGLPVSAGIYFTTVQAGLEVQNQKMLLIK